jgi:hypothetical protein
MRFKQWLLNEGFELPFRVIKDIYEYYRDSYEKYRLKPRVKIEPKYFDLDFTGTRYEFLNDLNPRVFVELKGSLPGAAGLASGAQLINGRGTARIKLALVHFVNSSDVIYHEVLHVVQDLIRIKKGMKVIGGLPNMPLVKRITDKRGISIGGTKKVKRVQHGVRPIEYYTNLDSLIRILQYRYVRMLLDSGKDIDLGVRASEAKKEFFSRIKKENSWISDKLDTVKFDEELYRIYLQEISKRFILNNNFGPDVMPMATDIGKFLASDWQAAAERAGVSVEELKKRQEKWHKEMQKREQELETKENEKKEQEKSEKTKEEKTNREKLVKQINVYDDRGITNYSYFSDFNPNFDKLLNLIKQTVKNNGSDTNVLIAANLMGWMGDVRKTLENILDVIKFNHKTIDVFKGYKKTREIIANRDEKYNLDSFYMYFGNLKSTKLWYESIKEKEIAKFFELFAEKLAEVFSAALKLGSSGKKLILDNFYRNPVARAARYSR